MLLKMKTALPRGIHSFLCIWENVWNALAEENSLSVHSITEFKMDKQLFEARPHFLTLLSIGQMIRTGDGPECQVCAWVDKSQTCTLFRAPTSEFCTCRATYLSRPGRLPGRLPGRSKKSTSAWCPEGRNGKPGSHILICPDCSWRHIRKSNLEMGHCAYEKKPDLLILTKTSILNTVIFFFMRN